MLTFCYFLLIFDFARFLPSPEETKAVQEASERLHSNLEFVQKQQVMQASGDPPASIADWQGGGLQQLDCAWEVEPAFEALIDHESVRVISSLFLTRVFAHFCPLFCR